VKVAILIPAFNAEATLASLLHSISTLFDRRNIFVVDDGSSDTTSAIARQGGVNLLRHKCNLGKGAAHRTGFSYILKQGYDALITLDADGQHDYRSLPDFVELARTENADIVVGSRRGDLSGMPLIRVLTNRTTSLVVSLLSGQRVADSQSGYRLIRTGPLRDIRLTTRNYQTESEILIKAGRKGYRIVSLPIRTIYAEEVSYIQPGTDTLRFIWLAIRSLWF
jgi:glycosyltransferase involved in cell wall biosynthesis